MASARYKIRTPKNPNYAGRQHSVQFARGEGVGTQAQAEYLRDTFGYEIKRVSESEADELAAAIDPTPKRGGAVTDRTGEVTAPETKKAADGTEVTTEGEDANTEPDELTRVKGIGPATAKLVAECLVPTLDALATVDAETLAGALTEKGATGISAKVVEGWAAQARTIVETS